MNGIFSWDARSPYASFVRHCCFCVVLCSFEICVKVGYVAFPSSCFCSGWRGVVFFIAVVVTIEAALDKLRSVVLI